MTWKWCMRSVIQYMNGIQTKLNLWYINWLVSLASPNAQWMANQMNAICYDTHLPLSLAMDVSVCVCRWRSFRSSTAYNWISLSVNKKVPQRSTGINWETSKRTNDANVLTVAYDHKQTQYSQMHTHENNQFRGQLNFGRGKMRCIKLETCFVHNLSEWSKNWYAAIWGFSRIQCMLKSMQSNFACFPWTTLC